MQRSNNRKSEGERTRRSVERRDENERMQSRRVRRLHRMRRDMRQGREKRGVQAVHATGTTLASAGIVLCARRWMMLRLTRTVRRMIAIVRRMNRLRVAGLDSKGKRRCHRRENHRQGQQQRQQACDMRGANHDQTLYQIAIPARNPGIRRFRPAFPWPGCAIIPRDPFHAPVFPGAIVISCCV